MTTETISRQTIACIIGTRPEAIKMAPIVHALQSSSWARCVVIVTAQHRDLLDQMMDRLNVEIDYDLNLMTEGQTPSKLLSRILPTLDQLLSKEKFSAVLAQGDTTTVFAASLFAFHHQIPFGHVEAGLRTNNLLEPFPEEGYRQMVSRVTKWNFAPTEQAAENLRSEGIPSSSIHITGNTCIDTLFSSIDNLDPPPSRPGRLILVTAHRRENFGQPLESIFNALLEIANRHPDIEIAYPVHPNPNVQGPAHKILGGHPRINLLPPQDYFQFIDLMRQSTLILTDSGGIQEEAPSLGKPVLVLRNQTERPEGLAAGVSKLVGTDTDTIADETSNLLNNDTEYEAMSRNVSPYGNGHAAQLISELIRKDLCSADN